MARKTPKFMASKVIGTHTNASADHEVGQALGERAGRPMVAASARIIITPAKMAWRSSIQTIAVGGRNRENSPV